MEEITNLQIKAEQGDAGAQYKLAECYYFGRGVTIDREKAVCWLTKAAEQGHIKAQVFLSFCYYFGQGVQANLKTSEYWYIKVSEQSEANTECFGGLELLNMIIQI